MIIWIKIGKTFINQDMIRSLKRQGNQTVVSLLDNNYYLVDANYEKVLELLPQGVNQL
jgi:hypothetical protein